MAIRQTLTGDATGAVKAIGDLQKAIKKGDEELKKTTKSAKGLEQQARRINEQADPQRRYNRQIDQLALLVKKGEVNLREANIVAAKYGQRLERAGRAGKEAFGQRVAGPLNSMIGRFASAAAVVGTITAALRDAEAQAQQTADSVFRSLDAFGELQQVSENPEAFAKQVGFARSLVARGIVSPENRELAADIAFQLTSAGFTDSEKEILASAAEAKQIRSSGIVGFGGALRKAQGLFGGAEGISVADIADRILSTSAATQANATQTALASAQFASASQSLGFNGDASLAALVLVEEKAKNIDEAATQVANLFDAIDKGGLSKGTLAETVDFIQSRIESGEGAFDILGNKRAVKGFRAIASQRSLLQPEIDRIANSQGALGRQRFIESDPILRSAALREAAQGRLASQTEAIAAEKENLFEVVAAERKAVRREELGTLGAAILGYAERLDDFLGREEASFVSALRGDSISPETRRVLEDYLQRTAAATERAAAAVESNSGPQE